MNNSIKKILQDIAYTAGVAADETKNAVQTVGKKFTNAADAAKTNMEILSLRADMEDTFAEIGRIIYMMDNGGFSASQLEEETAEGSPNRTINDLLIKAAEKQEQIDFLTEKLSSLKSGNICPGCGRKCKNSEIFCSICGARVKPEEPEEKADENETPAEQTAPEQPAENSADENANLF